MKNKFLLTVSLMFVTCLIQAQVSQMYVHHSSKENTSGNSTKLSSTEFDYNPNFVLMITHNHNPPGSKALVHDEKVGLYYSGGFWYIFNQDKTPMDTGLNFNVIIPGSDATAWIRVADSSETDNNYTIIDHPSINNDPNAIFFVSDVWNPNGKILGVYNTIINGIYYNNVNKRWYIFNQNKASAMIKGSAYSIVLPNKNSDIVHYTQRAMKSNIQSNGTLINHPDANGNPKAKIFITQNLNPGTNNVVYNNKNVGVFYNGSSWVIYNEDLSSMDTGVSFNIMIYSEKTSSIKTQNLQSQVHIFPNPVLNGAELEIKINNQILSDFTIEVSDPLGKKIISKQCYKNLIDFKESLSLEGISKGIYFLHIYNNGFNSIQKFVIE